MSRRSIRRHKIPAPRPTTFECDCGNTHRSPDQRLPVGWATALGRSWCTDCASAGIPAREIAKAKRQRRAA